MNRQTALAMASIGAQLKQRCPVDSTVAPREPKWTPAMNRMRLQIQDDLKTRKPHLNSKQRKREARQAVLRQMVTPHLDGDKGRDCEDKEQR